MMTYKELEQSIIAAYRKEFTEFSKGGSLPNGEVQDSEWTVQADPEELQIWLREQLLKVHQHALQERNELQKSSSSITHKLKITLPDGTVRYVEVFEGQSPYDVVSRILDVERHRFSASAGQPAKIEEIPL